MHEMPKNLFVMWEKILLKVDEMSPFQKVIQVGAWTITGYALLLLFLQDVFLALDLVSRMVIAILVSLMVYFYVFFLVYVLLRLAGVGVPEEKYGTVLFFSVTTTLFTTLMCVTAYAFFMLIQLLQWSYRVQFTDMVFYYLSILIFFPLLLSVYKVMWWKKDFRFVD